MSAIASTPRLPVKVWLEIVRQPSSLGYYDLRRLRRVCRGLNDLLQDPSFRDRLFLQPSELIVPRRLECHHEVALHPLLHLLECFPEQTTEDLLVRAPPPRSLRTQALTSLEARNDMVTSPAVTLLQLEFQPDEESRSAFSVINVSNPKGVSVLDVYEGIVRLHQDLDAETFNVIFDVACEEGKDAGGYDVYKLFTEWSVMRVIDEGELALLIPVLMPPSRELVRSVFLFDPALLATADDCGLTSAGIGSTKGSYVESERMSLRPGSAVAFVGVWAWTAGDGSSQRWMSRFSFSCDTVASDERDEKDCCSRWTESYVVWTSLTLGSVGAR